MPTAFDLEYLKQIFDRKVERKDEVVISGKVLLFKDIDHLGHPHKMFRFPSPDRVKQVQKKKKFRITCKEASTLVYKHTILSY